MRPWTRKSSSYFESNPDPDTESGSRPASPCRSYALSKSSYMRIMLLASAHGAIVMGHWWCHGVCGEFNPRPRYRLFTWWGISMKLATNICHASGNCWKVFKVRGKRSRSHVWMLQRRRHASRIFRGYLWNSRETDEKFVQHPERITAGNERAILAR